MVKRRGDILLRIEENAGLLHVLVLRFAPVAFPGGDKRRGAQARRLAHSQGLRLPVEDGLHALEPVR